MYILTYLLVFITKQVSLKAYFTDMKFLIESNNEASKFEK